DSAALVATLRDAGVQTVMVTGDSPATAAAIARQVGIDGDVFARVVPEEKYRLVKTLQSRGHVVGMCGDGTNDAPALRQAQIGIAVSGATDVAKAAAALVLTEPGLAGVVHAVREGRVAFQRLLAFTFNMLVKKTEIVLFLAIGLVSTGRAVMTPTLMVLMLVTNDLLAMSLTTDRASPARSPSRWRMRDITSAGIALGACKLAFSVGVLEYGKSRLGLGPEALQTLAFVVLVFGSQAVLFVVRERRRLWSSAPGRWVVAASLADVGIVIVLASAGILMSPLPWRTVAAVLGAAIGFALVLDQVKRPVLAAFKLEERRQT
ncbi:MAG: HAD-IC family P-type ATPase, partial [Burkholderiales bacterium]